MTRNQSHVLKQCFVANQDCDVTPLVPHTMLMEARPNLMPRNITKYLDLMMKIYYDLQYRQKIQYEDDDVGPSYSLIQGLTEDGFMFDVFPFSHLYERESFMWHRYMCLRMVIPGSCCIIFSSDTLHNGTRSRLIKNGFSNHSQDERFFFYIQQDKNNDGSSSKRPSICSETSLSPQMNFNPKSRKICPNLENHTTVCAHCLAHDPHGPKILNLEEAHWRNYISTKNVGDVILGDLVRYGFVVLKSDQSTYKTLEFVTLLKQVGKSKFEVLNNEPNRKLLYPSDRSDIELKGNKFADCPLHNHMRNVFEKVAKPHIGGKCRMVRPNVIWNEKPIPKDQLPHYDYPARKKMDDTENNMSMSLRSKSKKN